MFSANVNLVFGFLKKILDLPHENLVNVHGIGTNIHGCQPKLEMYQKYTTKGGIFLFIKFFELPPSFLCTYIEIVDKSIIFSLLFWLSASARTTSTFLKMNYNKELPLSPWLMSLERFQVRQKKTIALVRFRE